MKRILIIDDSAIIRRTLRTLLEQQADWTVCGEAADGGHGSEKARELHPDIIVIDLAMPVMNGIEATRILKRVMPATPILMFTTFANPHLKKEAETAGVDAFIDKSEGAMTLVKSIQRLLTSKLPSRSSAAA